MRDIEGVKSFRRSSSVVVEAIVPRFLDVNLTSSIVWIV
jgi:hypothetical protein